MLQRAHQFSATLVGEDREAMRDRLLRSNAFKDSGEGVLDIVL